MHAHGYGYACTQSIFVYCSLFVWKRFGSGFGIVLTRFVNISILQAGGIVTNQILDAAAALAVTAEQAQKRISLICE